MKVKHISRYILKLMRKVIEIMEVLREKEFYKGKIIEMVEKIENPEFLESIYWFAKTIFEKYAKSKEG